MAFKPTHSHTVAKYHGGSPSPEYNEFTFRLNEGNVKRHSLERLDSFVGAICGKRLTYAELTA